MERPPRSGGLSEPDDLGLARAAAAGEVGAFTALVRRHERRVRGFLARLTRGDGADDLAQETFLRAWRSAAAWRGEGSYEGWLLRIAWRTFLSSRRGRRDEPTADLDDHAGPARDAEARLDVERALARLPARERAVAALCFGEGCSHGEAAAILELPLGTVKSLAARAKAALARTLEEHQG